MFVRNVVLALALCSIFSVANAQLPYRIQSLVDEKFITITETLEGPTGPYQTRAVQTQDKADEKQIWEYHLLPSGPSPKFNIFPQDGSYWNSLTAYVPADDSFGLSKTWYIVYNQDQITFRLRNAESGLCFLNPEDGGFIREVQCSNLSPGQHWRFVDV